MMAISTRGIGAMDITSGADKAANAKNKKQTESFADIMNLSAGNTEKNVNAADATGVKGNENVRNVHDEETSDHKAEASDEPKAQDVAQASKAKEKTDGADKAEVKETAEAVDDAGESEAVCDTEAGDDIIKAAIEELTAFLMELFGMNEQELNNIVSDMNIDMTELLVPEKLNSFVLQLNNATSVDVLVNEDLNNLLNKCSNMLENLAQKYDISIVDAVSEDMSADNALTAADLSKTADVDSDVEVIDGVAYESLADVADKNAAQSGQEADMSQSGSGNSFTQSNKAFKTEADSNVISNIGQAVSEIVNDGINTVEADSEPVSNVDIVRQIVDEIEATVTRDNTSIELQLNPVHLGKVQISVSTKDGVMQARIVTENEAAKNAIETSLISLKEAFDNKELKVEAIEVMVGTSDFFNASTDDEAAAGQGNNNSHNSSSGMGADSEDSDEAEASRLEAEMMRTQGNTVSYTI